jgi:hypothetical protein
MTIPAVLGGCATFKRLFGEQVPTALQIVDQGIATIDANSAQWQTALRQVADQLPADAASLVRVEAQNLATRSVATTGSQIRCTTDFMGARAKASLGELRRAILGGRAPQPLPPVLCAVAPAQIEVGLPPDRWGTVTFSGWDLDHRDRDSKMVEAVLINADGQQVAIPDGLVNRTTHYEMTLNLGDPALRCTLLSSNVRKIALLYGGERMSQGEVAIVPWTAREQRVTAHLGHTSHAPTHTRGDQDFDADDDDHIEVRAEAEMRVTGDREIQTRVFLRAHEPRPDWTTAEAWTGWATAYTAPPGYRIVSVNPNGRSVQTANITTHGPMLFQRPGGEPVASFQVFGDRDGDEAGTWTRVVVTWRNADVVIRETHPTHLQCPV